MWTLFWMLIGAVTLAGCNGGSDDTPHDDPGPVQHVPAATVAVKLGIQEEGWYRVDQPALLAAGLDPTVDPRYLQLFVAEDEVPVIVTGAEDGSFDPEDAIEFYGVGLDTPWTDTRVYWLVEGTQLGQRLAQMDAPEPGNPAPVSFPYTVERRERSLYVAAVHNGEAENFFGPVITTEPKEQVLHLQHVDPTAPQDALLEVALQGVTDDTHQVTIRLNGRVAGTAVFTGQRHELTALSVAHTELQAGKNLVTLATDGDGTAVSVLDTIRLTYRRTYTAHEDALWVTAQEGEVVTIAGFASPAIRVVDVTDPETVWQVAGDVTPQGSGFDVTVSVPGPGLRTLVAFIEAGVKVPATITADQPSTWRQETHAADLVIIAHRSFLASTAPLRALREAQGWTVALVDVEDLYDEFAFGAKTPEALRDFLVWTQAHWQQPPSHVLLVGDASYDPRNYLELEAVDFVPTKLVDTAVLETASDDWFGDIDGDGYTDLAIGRLPVRTVEEADTVISKLVRYAEVDATGAWTRDVLVVADDNDSFDFAAASTAASALLPADMTIVDIDLGQTDPVSARDELLAHLHTGQLLVNYVGHGSVEAWAGEGLLTSADARALTNGAQLPVVLTLTCLNGFFHDVFSESLAEALLKAEQGGAVAVWASTGLTGPAGQAVLNQELVWQLFGEEALTLGEAAVRAKSAVVASDVRRTWILFGDPTMRLK